MLFDVTAFLATSVAFGSVTEAIDAPRSASLGMAIVRVDSRAPGLLDGIEPFGVEPQVGPHVDPAGVSGPSGHQPAAPLLLRLSSLPSDRLPTFVRANPQFVAELLTAPPAPRLVTEWWGHLESATRVTLIASSPQLVGNLEGVPYSVRDAANRAYLDQVMDDLRAVLEQSGGRTAAEEARRELHMLEGVAAALAVPEGGAQRTLVSLDASGEGRATIVVGDLRTADYVSYLVPGMFFSVDGQMGDWTDAASRLHDDQLEWLHRFAAQGAADPESTVATVAWLGYETPNLTDVGGPEKALIGRDLLASAVEGLLAMRKTDPPHVALITHSYGSTAALMALTEYDFEVDALALVGSPGSAAQSVAELHVRGGNVFVGEAAWDPVPNSSFFGSDPGTASYGAHPMGVGGTVDVITHRVLLGSTGHNEYFSPGTESMRNLALIGIGMGEYVTSGTGAPGKAAGGRH